MAGLAALALVGCATVPGRIDAGASDAEKAKVVAKAAKERWDLIIAGQLGKAYDYLSKGSQQLYTRDAFAATMGQLKYRAAEVEKVECEKELCRARIRLTYDHSIMKGAVTPLDENWLIEEGRAGLVWRT